MKVQIVADKPPHRPSESQKKSTCPRRSPAEPPDGYAKEDEIAQVNEPTSEQAYDLTARCDHHQIPSATYPLDKSMRKYGWKPASATVVPATGGDEMGEVEELRHVERKDQ